MKYSYQWLKTFLPSLPPPQGVADAISLHAFEVEDMARKGKDTQMVISVLPNRVADAGGHEGMARELGAILNKKVTYRTPVMKESPTVRTAGQVRVKLQAEGDVTRYSLRIVDKVAVGKSPAHIVERLATCDIQSINNIVDAANYVMLETGQPLHVFDADTIKGGITVRRSVRGERIETLDGADIELPIGTLVIADNDGPIAIAGIKGGARTGVTEGTTRVAIEGAHFDRALIRKTAKLLGISTDASQRFAAGLHPSLAAHGVDRLAALVRDVAGGVVLRGRIDVGESDPSPARMSLSTAHVTAMLGVEIPEKEIEAILKRLGCAVTRLAKSSYRVIAPSFRIDLSNETDVIEEVGRIAGYDRVPTTPPSAQLVPPHANDLHELKEELRDLLAATGYSEVMNYAFMSADDAAKLLMNTNDLIPLENPISSNSAYMRGTLHAGMFKNIRTHQDGKYNPKFFEIGRVFLQTPKHVTERDHLTLMLARPQESNGDLFFEAKGDISTVLERFGIPEHKLHNFRERRDTHWPMIAEHVAHPYRAATIDIEGAHVGVIYEVHPEVLRRFDITLRVAVVEIMLTELLDLIEEEKEFRPISKYPAVVRDISLLVPADTRVDEAQGIIEREGGMLLIDSDLFDYYEGDTIGAERRSLAFHLVFQSHDRTLTDEEVDRMMQRIENALTELEGWEIR